MMEDWAYGGEVAPPGTVVVAKEAFVGRYGAEKLTVSHYSRVLGLNAVILLDGNGKQQADITQKELREQFNIAALSNEDDDFQHRAPISERYWASARGE